jgi:transposase-like protein
MLTEKDPVTLKEVVEVDATYWGGKLKNKHARERKALSDKNGRGTGGKTPIIGLLQRNGKVTAFTVKNEGGETVKPIIREIVDKDAVVMTDAHGGYKDLHHEFNHVVINHQGGEYVKGEYHTNNIEGFWGILKRGLNGIHHSVSTKHINRYCSEYAYRYNERGLTQDAKFALALTRCNGGLKYKDLIGG